MKEFCKKVIFTVTGYLRTMGSRSKADSILYYLISMLIHHYITSLPNCGNSTEFKAVILSKIYSNTPFIQTHTLLCQTWKPRPNTDTRTIAILLEAKSTIITKHKEVLQEKKESKERMFAHGRKLKLQSIIPAVISKKKKIVFFFLWHSTLFLNQRMVWVGWNL